MPRSYSFEHYTAQSTEKSRGVRSTEKQHLAQSEKHDGGSHDIHYGKKFAETEELVHAKKMAHELEDLAGLPHEEPRQAVEPASAPVESTRPLEEARQQAEEAAPERNDSTPPPPVSIGQLYQHALGDVRQIGSSAATLMKAGWELAGLPWELVKLLAQQLRPQRV